MNHRHRNARWRARALLPLIPAGTLLLSGCMAEPIEEVSATRAELQLINAADWEVVADDITLTACWMTDDEFFNGTRSAKEDAAIAQIEAWIEDGWVDASSLSIVWHSRCDFTEDLRIYLDDVTGATFPGNVTGGHATLVVEGPRGGTYPDVPSRTDNVGDPSDWSGVCDGRHRLNADNTPVGESWGSYPLQRASGGDLEDCLYNIYLTTREWDGGPADGVPTLPPWRAHFLHEFGHVFGMAHEHGRSDSDCSTGEVTDGVYLTTYDADSVMHYTFAPDGTCQADGNYSTNDLSNSDRLGIELLYPPTTHAVIWGGTLFRPDQVATFQPRWVALGAYLDGEPSTAYLSGFNSLLEEGNDIVDEQDSPVVTYSTSRNGEGSFRVRTTFSDTLGRRWDGSLDFQVVSARVHTARLLPAYLHALSMFHAI